MAQSTPRGDRMSKILPAAGQLPQSQSSDQAQGLKRKLGNAGVDEKGLRKTCQDFEAIFMGKMWQQMRATVPKEGYLHGPQEEAYLSMFDDELSKKMAGAGGIGIANMLFTQLKTQLAQAGTGADQLKTPAGNPARPAPAITAAPTRNGMTAAAAQPVRTPVRPLENPSQTAAGQQVNRATMRPTEAPLPQRPGLQPVQPSRQEDTSVAAPPPDSRQLIRSVDQLAREIIAGDAASSFKDGAASLPSIMWPAQGKVVSSFGADGGQGVRISTRAAAVHACQEGRVVFADRPCAYVHPSGPQAAPQPPAAKALRAEVPPPAELRPARR